MDNQQQAEMLFKAIEYLEECEPVGIYSFENEHLGDDTFRGVLNNISDVANDLLEKLTN